MKRSYREISSSSEPHHNSKRASRSVNNCARIELVASSVIAAASRKAPCVVASATSVSFPHIGQNMTISLPSNTSPSANTTITRANTPTRMKSALSRNSAKAKRLGATKHVHFSDYSSLRFMPELNEEDNLDKSYSKDDILFFKRTLLDDVERTRQILDVMNTMQNQRSNDPQGGGGGVTASQSQRALCLCIGLEHLLAPEVALRIVQRRRRHFRAVFATQERQRVMNNFNCVSPQTRRDQDMEEMRRVSEECTEWSRERAKKLAVGYFNICLDESAHRAQL